ncbi:D-alanine--D-alanine ligase [Robiginitomaculum antarcticum]|uniref:D-alanine--D-alanine ligase n=1 Tax=Robiginitomaculum antarcticum TaxID=437507 RepID=UPI00037D7298|nr:D-alanine--D-alanine ligase [Robiginitomaculum antarcticum]
MTRVAVLYGGLSAEREVSLRSGTACGKALREEGYDVVMIDMTTSLMNQLRDAAPDVIFNALHGEWGEDGRVQGVLDLYGKPYTHSGVMASALAMDKQRAKAVLSDAGITVPQGRLVARDSLSAGHPMPLPYVIKPNAQGSSVGVFMVEAGAKTPPNEIADMPQMGEYVLIEPLIKGRELTVAVMDGKAMAVTEIIPAEGWYDYKAKYADGGSHHVVPAHIPDDVTQICMRWAEKAHIALGCRGLSRADLFYAPDGNYPPAAKFSEKNADINAVLTDIVNKVVMLEVNTQPGMTATSLAPEQAAFIGLSFNRLCRWIVEDATWPR